MNLLTILPEEVIEGCILPYLEWNDLLRFRRVCRTSKDITNGYMKTHPDLAPWIEINEKEKSFGAFLEMGIPTTKIAINNVPSGSEFYKKDEKDIAQFLEKYGPLVKLVRVREVSMFLHGKELDFLEALVNLQEYEGDSYGYWRILHTHTQEELEEISRKTLENMHADPRYIQNELPFPLVFHQLRSVKIGQDPDDTFLDNSVFQLTMGILKCAKDLEYVSMPFSTKWSQSVMDSIEQPEMFRDPRYMLFAAFAMVKAFIQEGAAAKLKVFDFINYNYLHVMEKRALIPVASRGFLELCEVSVKHNVKLWNVDPSWFQGRDYYPRGEIPDLGIPVVSLVGLNSYVFPLNMPNLERIFIPATSLSNIGQEWKEADRPDWPALNYLNIYVNSKQALPLDNWNGTTTPSHKTSVLFQFFFQDVQREALVELRLNFICMDGGVAVPKTEEIVSACPNLKKLFLFKWPGTNKALAKLWNGLQNLEEISLENCGDLGNVAFVGEDVNDPVFLKLTKLRKLTLTCLDRMPKITDTLFNLVLRHMNLSHFTITSTTPLTSVTSTGILWLLRGKFADSIEKFPFQNWSLAGVPPELFKKMEVKFRSYDML